MPCYSQTGHQLSSVGKKFFETQTVQDMGTELQSLALPSRSATSCSRPWLTLAATQAGVDQGPSIWLLPRPGAGRRLRQTVSYAGDVMAAGELEAGVSFCDSRPTLELDRS